MYQTDVLGIVFFGIQHSVLWYRLDLMKIKLDEMERNENKKATLFIPNGKYKMYGNESLGDLFVKMLCS